MSRRAYHEINLHIVWHVKDNVPVLRDEIEAQVHKFLRDRAAGQPEIVWHGQGGTDDHVHLVVSVPPTLLIADWVGDLKGASAHYINHRIANRKVLEWQAGYGVVSFGTRDLAWVLEYVKNQRARHAARRAHDRLERAEGDEDEKPAEAG